MKISIITVVFNGARTIAGCIDSVLGQDYPSIEYIIIDGNSGDGTREIVESYGSRIAHFVSEPDRGIYDAMNKGIAAASGEVIGILNADDFYADTTVISAVANCMNTEKTLACYGDLEYVEAENTGQVTRRWIAGAYKKRSFFNGWMPPHPSFFLARKAYSDWGLFRLDLGSAADYELMLRMIHKQEISPAYIPKVLVKMRVGGVSNNTLKNRWKANRNDRKAWRVNGLRPHFYTLILKPVRKISQFV